jgi:hypothetical protein
VATSIWGYFLKKDMEQIEFLSTEIQTQNEIIDYTKQALIDIKSQLIDEGKNEHCQTIKSLDVLIQKNTKD